MMKTLSTHRMITGVILSIVVVLVLASCTGGSSEKSSSASAGEKKLDGVYHGPPGSPITVTIKDKKATVLIGNDSKTLDYKVEGNKLTIVNPQEGDMEFTINDDGTLNSNIGVWSKTP